MTNLRCFSLAIASCVALFALITAAHAAPRVDVITGPNPSRLESLAAAELAEQFTLLFGAEIKHGKHLPAGDAPFVLIGTPETNPAIKQAVGDKWPKLSDQGLVVKSVSIGGRDGLIVGGGSPVATLWAAYEVGHRFGIRYVFRQDVYPKGTLPLNLSGLDVVMEPKLPVRTWRTVNDFAIGPESWGLADHRKLLKQLAKMKFNRVLISIYPWQPFVHYEYDGVAKETGVLWFGEELPIDRDMPGRTVFGSATTFNNPDLAHATTYKARTEAGTKLISGIIDAAHEFGMAVGVLINPFEFPREFEKVLPGAKVATGLKQLTITPGEQQQPNDPKLIGLVQAQIRAYLDTYPTLDAIYVTMPEFPEWGEHADAAWKQLDQPGKLADFVEAAANRSLIASGDRGRQAVKGNVAGLALLQAVTAKQDVLKKGDGQPVELVVADVDPALAPVLDKVLPRGAGALNFIDYTARRVAQHDDMIKAFPADKVPSSLIFTLADDNIGILSQSVAGSLESLTNDIQAAKWQGFSTRYWMLAELDPSVYFLSRRAFDDDVTAHSAFVDLFTTMGDDSSAAERLWLAFQHIETATNLLDENDLGFSFPVEGMLMKHYNGNPLPEWFTKVFDAYVNSSNELYRAHDAVEPRARRLLYYYCKRSEYNLEYLGAVQAVKEAGIAKAEGKHDVALEKLEAALESLYNAMDTLGDVAQDQSDRGLIAVLNAHAYRPLKEEIERLSEEQAER